MSGKVKVSIFNENFSLVTTENELHVRQAAALVDEIMQTISFGKTLESKNVAILAALRLASDFLKAQSVEKHLEDACKRMSELLDKESDLFKTCSF